MSLTRIPSCTGSSSSRLIRLYSKHRIRRKDPSNFDSRTSILKSSCGGSESDGEYETSSEGRLHPGPETRASLCRTQDSGSTIVNDDTSSKTEVSTELRLEVVGSTQNNENSAKSEDAVGTISHVPSKSKIQVKVQSIQKTDHLVSSLLEPVFSSEPDRSSECFPSDSLKSLQSGKTKSNSVLSIGKNSTADLQSIYKENKFQSDTYSCSIEMDSVSKVEENRFEFVEHDQRVTTGENMNFFKEIPILIGINPKPSSSSIRLTHENLNGKYELKKKLIKTAQIMSQIDKGFAPLRDEMNKILNQIRDLKGMSFDFGTEYNNLLGISNSGCLSARGNSNFQNNSIRSTAFLPPLYNTPSTEYKLYPSNSYHTSQNYLSQSFQPSQEKLRFNEKLPSYPFKSINQPSTCFHKRISPRHFEHCPHAYLGKGVVTLENSHLQESFISNSLCNFHGNRVPHVADNSRHISLKDFPVVQQHLHSSHANVLPDNSENLHRRCRSKVPIALETSDSKMNRESRILPIANGNYDHNVEKQAEVCCSRHHHSSCKMGSRKNDENLKSSLDKTSKSNRIASPTSEKRHKKHDSKESSRNRPRPFSKRRRCKRHCCNLRHQMNSVSPTDNSLHKSGPPDLMKISTDLENRPLLKNGNTSGGICETLSRLEEPPQLITELTLITKEVVTIEESSNQLKPDLEFVEAPSSYSGSTIQTEIKYSPQNYIMFNDKEELQIKTPAKPCIEKVLATESLFQQKTSDLAQKKSSSIFSYSSHISRPHTGYKGLIEVLDHKFHDKACNTENIDEGGYRKKNLLNVEAINLVKPALSISKEIVKQSLTEIFKTGVSEKGSRKSISNQHSKMSLPKMHERITVVPIIFYSGMPEPLNENFDFTDFKRSGSDHKKTIPLNTGNEDSSSSESRFSLDTQASFSTEITHLAQKCAFVRDSKGRINSRTTLNSEGSSYSFKKPQGSPTRIERSKKTSNDSKTRETTSRSSTSYQTSLNPVRNFAVVRRIPGIRTSPEDFMYE